MTTRIAPGEGANLLGQHSAERNQEATVYVGNLDPQIMRDPDTGNSRGFGFISYDSFEASDAAVEVFFVSITFTSVNLATGKSSNIFQRNSFSGHVIL